MHARTGGKSGMKYVSEISEQAYGLKRESRPAAGESAPGRACVLKVNRGRSC